MPDDGHAPGLPQHLLPLLPVHVPHVSVVFGEPKDPDRPRKRCSVKAQIREAARQTSGTHLSSSVIHRMSSLPLVRTGSSDTSLPCFRELGFVVMVLTLVT